MIDIIEPTQAYSVSDWLRDAEAHLDRLRRAGDSAVIAGGTHLYIKALLDGLFEGPPGDDATRAALRAFGREELRRRLLAVDPVAAERIHPNDLRRTVRALEVHALTGRPISELQSQWDAERPRRDTLLVPIVWETEALNRRINARVRQMLDEGLVEEVRGLLESGRLGTQAREGIGYAQIVDHLEGRLTLDEAVERIKIDSRRLAKNQRTWMRRILAGPPSLTLPGAEITPEEGARRVVERLLSHP
jgi:tRNA dimethylallyltransferase